MIESHPPERKRGVQRPKLTWKKGGLWPISMLGDFPSWSSRWLHPESEEHLNAYSVAWADWKLYKMCLRNVIDSALHYPPIGASHTNLKKRRLTYLKDSGMIAEPCRAQEKEDQKGQQTDFDDMQSSSRSLCSIEFTERGEPHRHRESRMGRWHAQPIAVNRTLSHVVRAFRSAIGACLHLRFCT